MKYNLLVISLLLSAISFGQYDLEAVEKDSVPKEPKLNWYEIKKRTFVGGDLSMRFGNLTYIYAAPLVGYDIFPKKLSAGITGIYQLIRLNDGFTVETESTAGAGVFVRYRPFDFMLLQTEFDLLNTENYTSAPGKRINVPAFLLGGGYCGSMGDRAYYNVMLMFDLINDPNMPVPKFINPFPVYLRYGFAWYIG